MKTRSPLLLLVLLLGFGLRAGAQTVDPGILQDRVTYAGGGKYLDADGKRLDDDDLAARFGEELFADYRYSQARYRRGIVMTSVGSALILTGLVVDGISAYRMFTDPEVDSDNRWEHMQGALYFLPASIGGVALLAFGIPKIVLENGMMRAFADEYNASLAPVEITFGPQLHGAGLALRF